ncbi:MAG: gliding motility-associated C-terminal domain-containing protein [Bacteroidia bacterium]
MFEPLRTRVNRVFLILFFLSAGSISAQNCIEIESILVDACDNGSSSPEGNNEMWRFRTFDLPINIANIEIFNGWPSESTNGFPFNGFIQGGQTALRTQELNATIQSCGYLVEPPNGEIPPNSRVLGITSYSISPTLNSFANLSDTLYIIYHNSAGVTGGHFLNYNTGSPQDQTLRMRVNGANGCEEVVTYQRGSLVDVNGNNTAQNGAIVLFSPDGIPTYANYGCQAPITPFSANWVNPGPLCTGTDPIDLNNLVTGTAGGTWSGEGVTGSIFDPSNVDGSVDITYTVLPPNECIAIGDSLTLTVVVTPSVDAEFMNPGSICGSQGTLDLTSLLNGNEGGTWTGLGVSGSTMDVSGINGQVTIGYSIGSGTCLSTHSETFEVIQLTPLNFTGETFYCNSDTPEALTTDAEPGAQVLWYNVEDLSASPIATGAEFTPEAGVSATYYAVQVMDACTSAFNSVEVRFIVIPSPEGDTLLDYCEGSSIPLASVTADGDVNWYDDQNLTNQINSGLTYQSTEPEATFYVTNEMEGCVSEPLIIQIVLLPELEAQILTPDGLSLCQTSEIQLVSAQSGFNSWNTGEESDAITVTTAGNYVLTREGPCNTVSDQVVVTGAPVFAEFTADPDSGYIPLEVSLVDYTTGADACQWFLDGDSLELASGFNLSFPDSGTYEIMLVCSNLEGCVDTASATIKAISDQLLLLVPNVFTPNGDFFNEQFKVGHNAVKTFTGRVFDRWGKLLYTWEDVTGGWDGTVNGNNAPEGTYFYVIDGTDIKDAPFDTKGTVLLIRN